MMAKGSIDSYIIKKRAEAEESAKRAKEALKEIEALLEEAKQMLANHQDNE